MRPPIGRRVLRLLVALAAAVFLYLVRGILTPFILAFFLAYLIEPLVLMLQKRGASRSLAILTVFGTIALLTAVLVAVVLPVLAGELEKAVRAAPQYLARLQEAGRRLSGLYNRLHLPLNVRAMVDRLTAQASERVENTVSATLAFFLRLLPGSVIFLIVPVISYYISRDYPRGRHVLYVWLRARARLDLVEKALAVDLVLQEYFRGQALSILVMTLVLTAGLALLRVDFALLLGPLAGILNIIPYFGPLLGALPAVLVAMGRSPWHMIYVIALFVAANQLEAAYLTPRIVGGRVGLHPLLVIFSLLAGGKLFGLLGMIAAVPATAAIKVAVSEYLQAMVAPDPDLTRLGPSGKMEALEEDPSKKPDGG